jgi:hypothetical protein
MSSISVIYKFACKGTNKREQYKTKYEVFAFIVEREYFRGKASKDETPRTIQNKIPNKSEITRNKGKKPKKIWCFTILFVPLHRQKRN